MKRSFWVDPVASPKQRPVNREGKKFTGFRRSKLDTLFDGASRTTNISVENVPMKESRCLSLKNNNQQTNKRFKKKKLRLLSIIIIMEICKAPTLRLKAPNKYSITHVMYIEMENIISNKK